MDENVKFVLMQILSESTGRWVPLKRIFPFLGLFLFLVVLYLVVASQAFLANADLLSLGITLDLVLVIPFLYFLIIRKRRIPKTTVVPVFIFGVVMASVFLPEENQNYLDLVKTWLLPVVELSVLSVVIFKVRAMIKSFSTYDRANRDFFTILKEVCELQFPKIVAKAIVMELSVFYYGFFRWQKLSLSKDQFSYHNESPAKAILGTLLFLVMAETMVFHILLMNWSLTAAWILTGLSTYSGFQVYGILKSLAYRPHELSEKSLFLSFGIMNQTEINYGEIEEILPSGPNLDEGGFATLSPLGSLDTCNVVLKLKKKHVLEGLYGTKKKYKTLALSLDEPKAFVSAVQQRIFENQR